MTSTMCLSFVGFIGNYRAVVRRWMISLVWLVGACGRADGDGGVAGAEDVRAGGTRADELMQTVN